MAPKAHHIIDEAKYCRTVSEAVAESAQVLATTARPRTQNWAVQTPSEAGHAIAQNQTPTAILFGPEDSGLSNEDLALAESIITFPTTSISSLNLGQAVTATCAALRAEHHAQTTQQQNLATPVPVKKREELVDRTIETLESSGYLDGRSRRLVTNTLMKITAKANLSEDEINNLMGMIKQANWWFKARL